MSLELSQEDSQEPLPPAAEGDDEWLEQLKARGTWSLGVILGPTGSNKTLTLSTLKHLDLIVGVLRQTDVADTWPNDKAIISAIAQAHGGNPQRAIDRQERTDQRRPRRPRPDRRGEARERGPGALRWCGERSLVRSYGLANSWVFVDSSLG